jgi:hypothetical protein
VRDHDSIAIREFNGLFDRGREEACPIDHFLEAVNVCYSLRSFRTRDGFDHRISPSVDSIGKVRRAHIFRIPGQAVRILMLIQPTAGSTWHIYDHLNMAAPIISITGMTDFSAITLYGRAYITPHNGLKGLPGEKVYVYTGTGTARPAGGSPPSGFTLGVAAGAGGKIEKGDHLFAVAYETSTGFITKPGPSAFTKFVAPGGTKADVTAIPIGPAGTVARHILATKIIKEYNGNQEDYELFFIPIDGRIGNNGDTTKTVDFFDSDLVTSADYLLDERTEIPAGVFIDEYLGRMVVGGTDTEEAVMHVSKVGEPESFSSVDGFVTVIPAEGGGIKAGVGYRGSYYLMKTSRTYMTEATTEFPNTWPLVEIDSGIGTSCHGVSVVLDSAGHTSDMFLIADQGGLRKFNGSYGTKDLTWKVAGLWKSITKSLFHKVQVMVDPIGYHLYILAPFFGAAFPNKILYGDFSHGMEPDLIKWSLWDLGLTEHTSILIDQLTNDVYQFNVAGFHSAHGVALGGIFTQLPNRRNDLGTIFGGTIAINQVVETFLSSIDDEGGINHWTAARINAIGRGDIAISCRSEGSVITETLNSMHLGSDPAGIPAITDREALMDFKAPRMALKLQMNTADNWMEISRITMYSKPMWVSI